VGRFFIGTFGVGASFRPTLIVTNSVFNPSGDWGATYMLAHPRNPIAELVCDFHGKVLTASGRFGYRVTITNTGPAATLVDLDF